eukprot:373640-Rhodomonas_salina.1
MKLVKVPGTENMADALTKSVPFPTLEKHRRCSGVPFSAFWTKVEGWEGVAVFKLELEEWE